MNCQKLEVKIMKNGKYILFNEIRLTNSEKRSIIKSQKEQKFHKRQKRIN